jgi:hypothetical protein
VRREAGAFLHFLTRHDLHAARLRERRRMLMEELSALAGQVPESVLAAEGPD